MHKIHLIFPIFIFNIITGCVAPQNIKWSQVEGPTLNNSAVYGSYSAGCLDGAVSLAASSEHYQVMRITRKRYYGHPRLIHFLENFASKVYVSDFGSLLIGDLSQARGGPMPGGHASHQVGLDADIWFKRLPVNERNYMSLDDVESMSATSVISEDLSTINSSSWTEQNATVLKIASSFNEVERIFVNFVIKKQLCEKHKGETWLSKIRPWWGHNYHYHVRLACPEGSPGCKSQAVIAENDGCNETLDWWFSEEAQNELDKTVVKKIKVVDLPFQCDGLLKE